MKRAVVLVLGMVTVFARPDSPLGQGMPPTLVETQPVVSREFHDQITLVGRTEAKASSRIVAEVTGRVIRIDAPEGNWVERGDVLVSIDRRRIRYALDARRAQVAQAQAAATLAAKNLARTEDLHRRDLAPEGDYDRDVAEAARTTELYNQLLAEQKTLELDLANCSVRAPFSGFTVRKLVDVGEGVGPGTAVYELVDLSVVKATLDLPERHFGHVVTGSEVLIRTSSGGDPVTGRVTGFAPNASEDTHTFPVIVAIDNSEGRLGGGMLVRATVSLDEVFTSLAVHKDAIVRRGAETMVYTIAEGKAAPIPVIVGSMSGDFVAVSGEGIAEGTEVVVRGNERIFPGSPVRTADEAPQGGGADEGQGADASGGEEKGGGGEGQAERGDGDEQQDEQG